MKKLVFILVIIFFVSLNVSAIDDFGEIENSIPECYSFFGSAEEIFNGILNNELKLNGENIFEKLLELLGASVKNILPHVSGLMGITIVLSVVEKLKLIDSSCESAAMMGGRIIFCVLLINSSIVFLNSAKESLLSISEFTQVLLPMIMTFLAAAGAQGSVSILGPSQVLMSSVLINIGVNIVFPLIIVGFVASAVNGIISDNKLKGISDFFKNVASWIIGAVFTVFSAIIALQGVAASVSDGISIKSIKYALSASVPIIGSSISESISTVLLSAFSIKSAAGIMGMIIIAGIVVVPIINIWVYILILNCFGACVQPFAGHFIVDEIKNICEFLKLGATVLFGISVLWFVYFGVLACAGGNLF